MNQFEVMVLSSEMEGMPYAILDAMGLGKPVVASSVGGVPDQIVHGETGFLVPPRDVQSLTEAIRTLLLDPALRQRMAIAARSRYEQLFTLDAMIADKLAEYCSRETSLFHAGLRLDPTVPMHSGTRTVNLYVQAKSEYSYYKISDPDCHQPTEHAEDFPELVQFIEKLPLKSFGRAFIIFDFEGLDEPVHRDHEYEDLEQEFIWLRPNKIKQFHIYDRHTRKKHYVDSYSCWFNTRHFHGVTGVPGLAVSIRVDGTFTDELREHIKKQALVPPTNYTLMERISRRIKRRFFKSRAA